MALPTTADEGAFFKALLGEDDLGVVVRGHIHVEAQLNKLLEVVVPRINHVKGMQLDYFGRVHLALAMGLDEKLQSPLLAMGTLRNEFAHRIDAGITKERIKSLYKTFHTEEKELLQLFLTRLAKEELKGKNFTQIEPKDQFVLIATALRAALIANTILAEQARENSKK